MKNHYKVMVCAVLVSGAYCSQAAQAEKLSVESDFKREFSQVRKDIFRLEKELSEAQKACAVLQAEMKPMEADFERLKNYEKITCPNVPHYHELQDQLRKENARIQKITQDLAVLSEKKEQMVGLALTAGNKKSTGAVPRSKSQKKKLPSILKRRGARIFSAAASLKFKKSSTADKGTE